MLKKRIKLYCKVGTGTFKIVCIFPAGTSPEVLFTGIFRGPSPYTPGQLFRLALKNFWLRRRMAKPTAGCDTEPTRRAASIQLKMLLFLVPASTATIKQIKNITTITTSSLFSHTFCPKYLPRTSVGKMYSTYLYLYHNQFDNYALPHPIP